jgi:hypothetical protein
LVVLRGLSGDWYGHRGFMLSPDLEGHSCPHASISFLRPHRRWRRRWP